MNEIDLPGLGKPGTKSSPIIKLLASKVFPSTLRDMYIGGHRFPAAEALEVRMVDVTAANPMEAAMLYIEENKLIGKGSKGTFGPYKRVMNFEVIKRMEAVVESKITKSKL